MYVNYPLQATTELSSTPADSVASHIDWEEVDKLIENWALYLLPEKPCYYALVIKIMHVVCNYACST